MNTLTLTQIGERFHHAREEAGLTQQDVAQAVGLNRSSIANFEAGRQDTPLSRVIDMCTTVGITLATLMAIPDPCPTCGCVWRGVHTRPEGAQ